jgi:hypothetical protein
MSAPQIDTVSDILDAVTHECWQAVLGICGKNLPVLLAVTSAMHDIARINNTVWIEGKILTSKPVKKEGDEA